MTEKKLTIESKTGHNIPATLVESKGSTKMCILSHGIFVDRNENGRFERLSSRLLGKGISSLRFDLSGHGESLIPSDGASVITMAEELTDVINHVCREDYAKVYLVLSSFSGALFSIASGTFNFDGVDKFVFLNPVLDLKNAFMQAQKKEMADMFTEENIRNGLSGEGFSPVPHFQMSRHFLMEMSSIDVPKLYTSFAKKHLIIHGNNDELVDFQRVREISRNNKDSTWATIDNGQHAFTNIEHEKEAHGLLLDWINKP